MLHRVLEGLIKLFSAPFQVGEDLVVIMLHVRIVAAVKTIALHDEEIDHLTSTGQ